MNVDSYLEIFATLFGWTFYDTMWDILTGTGIAYIPFVWLILSNMLESHNNGMDVNAAPAIASLKRLEVELCSMLMVVILAAQPFLLMDCSSLIHKGVSCGPANPTTFGSAGFAPPAAAARVPVWWWGVMSVSAGINNVAKSSMPPVDQFREVAELARMATVDDPLLAEEIAQFRGDCFTPARSRYYAEKPTNPVIAGLLTTYGKDDVEWMGSHVYQASYYTYENFRARKPVPGYPYDAARDTEYADWAVPPTWGKPYCVEWWATAAVPNLQERINAYANALEGAAATLASWAVFTPSQREDYLTRLTLNNVPPGIVDDSYVQVSGTPLNKAMGLGAVAGQWAAGLAGSFVVDMLENVVLFLAKHGLPMLQALILMGMYALLPFVLVISGFSLEFVVLATLGIFTVKFWSFLWAMATWIDQNMIAAMYPAAGDFFGMLLNAQSVVQDSVSGKKIMLDLVTTSMFFVLPLIWTALMAWAGYRAMGGVTSLKDGLTQKLTNGAGEAKGAIRGIGNLAKKT